MNSFAGVAARLPSLQHVLLGNAILGVLYAVCGWVALWLTAPHYAAPVWPPAGIALVGALCYGWRVWPGLLLGAFAIELWAVMNAHTRVLADATALAAGLALGSTLQALLGAALVRRFVGFPGELSRGADVAVFLGLGGLLSCLLAATWGVATLVYAGVVVRPDAPLQWLTWWMGDSIGVFVFAPLALIAVGMPRAVWRRRAVPVGVPLCAALAVFLLVFAYAGERERERLELEFQRQAEITLDALKDSLDDYLGVLYSIESLFRTHVETSRHGFAEFVQRALSRYPGIQALSWNPLVGRDERAAYEEAARRDGLRDFQFTERGEDGRLRPAGDREQHVPVYFIEPLSGNQEAFGFDIASDPARWAALQEARDRAEPIASERIRLVQETGEQAGVLVSLPIYHHDRSQRTVRGRRAALRGFAVLVLRMGDVMSAALDGLRHAAGARWLVDESGDGGLLYADDAAAAPAPFDATGIWRESFEFAGRRWALSLAPGEPYVATHRASTGSTITAVGLILTGMLGGFLLVLTGRALALARVNAKLEREVAEREQVQLELQRHRNGLEQLVAQRTAALEQEIRESEAFSHSISHDLRSPLRSVDGYSSMLLEDYADKLDPVAVEYLRRSRSASQRMGKLIDALLELSRMSRRKMRVEVVDLSALVHELAGDLRESDPGREVRFFIEDGLTVRGDPYLLRTVLENLLSNAWKYSGGIEHAVIEFGRVRQDDANIFYVRDNGVGFDMHHADKLFQPFQRLHGVDEFEGTGIGLASTARIVHRHGGSVWAESSAGEGATFFFTIGDGLQGGHGAGR